ncbi:hypothetical protein EUTSA_v10005297mg [Eutrema salsugineum]|uniref:Protein kinase domain-containing protein n=1 Tax=Eutrema salsugineum TaxID=72664 RepID=V4MMM7_EUTSA|nr:serine/threonine-protein kinase CDG1 [Eutrema salsugineum]ESQ32786.1 hypothetical protein EUTSA_v10005297mg [Eutrema salsugineum]
MVCCLCFGLRTKPTLTQKQKQKGKGIADQKCRPDPSSSSAKPPASASSGSEKRRSYAIDTQIFTYRELATATNNFRTESLIGRGGFGAVFKGTLEKTEQIVAVKMLDTGGLQGDKEFLVEVLMLSLLRHENLVRLIGYCAEGDQRLLVYEYMPHGSVEDHLHNFKSETEILDWNTRIKIAAGAAKGIEHLHNVAKPPVIYRDLKTANILLDHGYNPKLSDFGLAKFGPSEDMTHVSTRVMGTHGYCAPEYANTGKLTLKSDIYSFGVVLLELISGRKAIVDSCMGSNRLLVNWARQFRDKNIKQILDPVLTIQDGFEPTVKYALEVAFMCLRENANARPTISEVLLALNHILYQLGEHTTSEQKKKSNGGGRGGNPGKRVVSPKETTSILKFNEIEEEEEEEGNDRERAVAEAKTWAETLRALRMKNSEPTTPTP